MAESHKLDYFCFFLLVAGHPQFAPDHFVTLIANAYNRKDIFTDAELKFSRSVQSSVQAFIEDGSNICGMEKCIVCQVFRKMHGFLIIHSDNKVIMKMWTNCHVGTLMASPLSVVDSPQSRIPPECYADHPRTLVEEKIAHMLQMYSRYIPPGHWPCYQADRSTTCTCIQSWSITSHTSTFYKPTSIIKEKEEV